jgi:hypothetical protein
MVQQNPELSSASILVISVVVALAGLVAYCLLTPISPAKMVALGHAAMSESITR